MSTLDLNGSEQTIWSMTLESLSGIYYLVKHGIL